MLMPAFTKPPEMIAIMRDAAAIAIGAIEMIGAHVKPGVSTAQLDALCQQFIEPKNRS